MTTFSILTIGNARRIVWAVRQGFVVLDGGTRVSFEEMLRHGLKVAPCFGLAQLPPLKGRR